MSGAVVRPTNSPLVSPPGNQTRTLQELLPESEDLLGEVNGAERLQGRTVVGALRLTGFPVQSPRHLSSHRWKGLCISLGASVSSGALPHTAGHLFPEAAHAKSVFGLISLSLSLN